TWSLIPAAGVGTISSTGLYTPPANVSSTFTVTVIATSAADPSKTGSTILTVNPVTAIAIFSTGVIAPGVPTPDGSVDTHYVLISSADPTAVGPSSFVANSNAFP